MSSRAPGIPGIFFRFYLLSKAASFSLSKLLTVVVIFFSKFVSEVANDFKLILKIKLIVRKHQIERIKMEVRLKMQLRRNATKLQEILKKFSSEWLYLGLNLTLEQSRKITCG